MLTLEEIVKEANRKRKSLGIKVSEKNYKPEFRGRRVVMIEDSPFVVSCEDGEVKVTPYFD